MNELVSEQASIFMSAIINGVFLGFIYDLIRVFRRIIKHSHWLVNLEDLIYWIVGSFIIFLDIFKNNDGVLRGFLYAGVFLGLVIYICLISRLTINVLMLIYNYIKKIIIFCYKVIIKPIKVVLIPIVFLGKKIFRLLKKIKKWLIIRCRKGYKVIKIIITKI